MALDTIILNPGAGGDLLGTDKIAGVDYELVKQAFGAIGDLQVVSQSNPLPVANYSSGSSVTSVNDSNVNQTLLASNIARLGATVYNDSSEALYLKFGATASTTDFTIRMEPQSYYEVPFGYTGRIDGIWANNGSGAAKITELTP